MKFIKVPLILFNERVEEFQKNLRQDINRSTETILRDGELIPAKELMFSLDYVKDVTKRGENGIMFELVARGRKVEDVENAAEEVVKIVENQQFTVAESLLFLQHIEEMILTSPVKY